MVDFDSLQPFFGIAAGILSFVAYPIYLRDIVRGNTKPSRVTWWVLSLLNILLTASYYAAGARDTIWIPVSYSVGFFVIALFSLKYGEGKWGRFDILCLLGAIASAIVWVVFQSAELTLYLVIAIDFLGLAPTMYKSCRRPWTENHTSWMLAAIASLLNVLAIGAWTPAIALYPVYVFITNGLMVYFIFHRPPVCD